jgi:hypothetical protein
MNDRTRKQTIIKNDKFIIYSPFLSCLPQDNLFPHSNEETSTQEQS